LSRSAGTIVNAIFGWAVVALFGRTSPSEQTRLSVVVGAAAAWPILLLGVVAPRVVAYIIAFIPLSKHIPTLVIRIVWGVLALAVPIAVGVVLAMKNPRGVGREPWWKRVLRGFPSTLGIAISFVMMFVTVPLLRLVSIARKQRDEHVPCITDDANAYQRATDQIDEVLRTHGIEVKRATPSRWLSAPASVLRFFGGEPTRALLPEKVSYWRGNDLEIAFYPSDVLIRGHRETATYLHGLLVEALASGPGLQSFDPTTQDLERRLRALWKAHASRGRVGLAATREELGAIARSLVRVTTAYEDWQVVYRQILQLGRALDGEPQLVEGLSRT
jgi:hypothetical protein